MDMERQKRIGIKQAKRTIANIYKKRKAAGQKLNNEDRETIAKQELIISRWQRVTKAGKGWHL